MEMLQHVALTIEKFTTQNPIDPAMVLAVGMLVMLGFAMLVSRDAAKKCPK